VDLFISACLFSIFGFRVRCAKLVSLLALPAPSMFYNVGGYWLSLAVAFFFMFLMKSGTLLGWFFKRRLPSVWLRNLHLLGAVGQCYSGVVFSK
jgi:hypothetical protein